MISMKVEGLADLETKLIALGEKVGTKILREAGRAALEIVQDDMKQHAGFDESNAGPHMRDSIKIRSTSRKNNGAAVVVLRVGPSKEHFMKALAQEYGTVKQVGDPFIRPALDYNRNKVLRILSVEIRDRIQSNR